MPRARPVGPSRRGSRSSSMSPPDKKRSGSCQKSSLILARRAASVSVCSMEKLKTIASAGSIRPSIQIPPISWALSAFLSLNVLLRQVRRDARCRRRRPSGGLSRFERPLRNGMKCAGACCELRIKKKVKIDFADFRLIFSPGYFAVCD